VFSDPSSCRAPEILLGAEVYSTPVDLWSVGCIYAELLLDQPVFQARNETEMISMVRSNAVQFGLILANRPSQVFKLLGTPTTDTWPEYKNLPLSKTIEVSQYSLATIRQKFPYLTAAGHNLLSSFLTYDPDQRIGAQEALEHPYFRYHPGHQICTSGY
jgi:cell division cycle 2-like